MTRIFLEESCSDVALYSGILYLWKDKKTLYLYDWNKWMNRIPFGDLPIYQIPFPFQKISSSIDDIHSCFIKKILFQKEIRDFFIYNHDLYYLTDDGFFVMTPESGDLQSDLISNEKFYSLSLSNLNRIALSGEAGVFEYFLSNNLKIHSNKKPISKSIHQWDSTPTYSTQWNGHDLLQLDEHQVPIQLLQFYTHKNLLRIKRKIPKKQLKEQIPYYNESLNLQYHENSSYWNTLFQYLPLEETRKTDSLDPFKSREIPVSVKPSLFFTHPLLQDHTLYIEENKQGLFLTIQNEQYLHVPHTGYSKWSTYPKSRNYQNHFHLLSQEGITFFLFHEIE